MAAHFWLATNGWSGRIAATAFVGEAGREALQSILINHSLADSTEEPKNKSNGIFYSRYQKI
jgi:hypothetical protein